MTDVVRIARGCWVPGETEFEGRCAAMLARAPAHTVVAGPAAAALHGLWLPDAVPRIELTTYTPGRRGNQMTRPRRGEISSHRRIMSEDELDVVRGVPVTSLARTWRDLAVPLALPDLVAAGDSALRAGLDRSELAEVMGRLRGRRGAVRAGAAFALLDERSRSRPESHLRVALSGLPAFGVNVAIHDELGQWIAEPDLSLRPAKLALEYQGADHATVKRLRQDITRFGDIRRAGWLALTFGPVEVFQRPGQIAAEVRHLIAQRAPELLAPARPRPRVGSSSSSGC